MKYNNEYGWNKWINEKFYIFQVKFIMNIKNLLKVTLRDFPFAWFVIFYFIFMTFCLIITSNINLFIKDNYFNKFKVSEVFYAKAYAFISYNER